MVFVFSFISFNIMLAISTARFAEMSSDVLSHIFEKIELSEDIIPLIICPDNWKFTLQSY